MKLESMVRTAVLGMGLLGSSAFADLVPPPKVIEINNSVQCNELYNILYVRETRLTSGLVSKSYTTSDKKVVIACERNPRDKNNCTCKITQKFDVTDN